MYNAALKSFGFFFDVTWKTRTKARNHPSVNAPIFLKCFLLLLAHLLLALEPFACLCGDAPPLWWKPSTSAFPLLTPWNVHSVWLARWCLCANEPHVSISRADFSELQTFLSICLLDTSFWKHAGHSPLVTMPWIAFHSDPALSAQSSPF